MDGCTRACTCRFHIGDFSLYHFRRSKMRRYAVLGIQYRNAGKTRGNARKRAVSFYFYSGNQKQDEGVIMRFVLNYIARRMKSCIFFLLIFILPPIISRFRKSVGARRNIRDPCCFIRLGKSHWNRITLKDRIFSPARHHDATRRFPTRNSFDFYDYQPALITHCA